MQIKIKKEKYTKVYTQIKHLGETHDEFISTFKKKGILDYNLLDFKTKTVLYCIVSPIIITPIIMEKYCNWENIELINWSLILRKCDGAHIYFEKQQDWNNIPERYWSEILISRPSLIHKCKAKIKPHTWIMILKEQPHLYKYCDFSEFDGSDIASLLTKHPYLKGKCDMSLLRSLDWAFLIQYQPQLFEAKYYDIYCSYLFDNVNKCIEYIPKKEVQILLKKYPKIIKPILISHI